MAKLKVTLKRSLISRPETQRKTVRSLGLCKINSFSILPDVPTIRGQIFKVKHLVAVEEIADDDDSVNLKKKSLTKAEKTISLDAENVSVEAGKKIIEAAKITMDAAKNSNAAVNEKVAAKAASIVNAVKNSIATPNEKILSKSKNIVNAVKGPAIAEKIVE